MTQQQTIKAIETVYNGYRFRSRLEARWAVFFDTLGIKYEYEKEGFDLGDGVRYLPDFWLPELKCWIEIKGQEPLADEHKKAHLLACSSGKMVFIFGDICVPEMQQDGSWRNNWGRPYFPTGHVNYEGISGVIPAFWYDCPHCDKVGITTGVDARGSLAYSTPCHCMHQWWTTIRQVTGLMPRDKGGWCGNAHDGYMPSWLAHIRRTTEEMMIFTEGIIDAFTTARQARFEHGETPLPPR